MDEKEGRRRATALGLRAVGIIGILLAAKKTGRVASMAVEIARLRAEAGFFVDRAENWLGWPCFPKLPAEEELRTDHSRLFRERNKEGAYNSGRTPVRA